MTIFEIENGIRECVDEETGEIIDIEKLEALEMARDQKIENVGMWYKESLAEANAIKAEKMKLAERQKTAENRAESLKNYLDFVVGGGKFESARVTISYRKSTAVEIEDESKVPDEFCKITREVRKTDLKDAIKKGVVIEGVTLLDKQNIQIK